MLKEALQTPKEKSQFNAAMCWCFDFDGTLTVLETYKKESNNNFYSLRPGYKLKSEVITTNLRNPKEIREFILERSKMGDSFLIITNHVDEKHVYAYLKTLLIDEDPYDIFSRIQLWDLDTEFVGQPGKNGHVANSVKNIGWRANDFTFVVIDNDPQVIASAKNAGYETIFVDKDNNYLNALKELAARFDQQSVLSNKLSSVELASDKENQGVFSFPSFRF